MKEKTVFVCSECDYQSPKWLGRCPSCNSWNTFEEQMAADEKKPAKQAQTAYCGTTSPAVLLDKLEMPVTYVYVTCREYKFKKAQRTDDDIASILNENMQNYINNLQEKGIQTISNSVRITMGEDGGTASGRK